MKEELAAHEERIAVLQRDLARMEGKVDALSSEVHEVNLMLAEWRGSWKGIVAVASIVGALLAWSSQFLLKAIGRSA